MTQALPRGLVEAFRAAAGELGMCSASWLFVREVSAALGREGVVALRDALGRAFPVLDTVAASHLELGREGPLLEVDAAVEALAGAARVVVVGIEATFLDAVLPRLGERRVALLQHSSLDVDWERLQANYGRRLELVDLDHFQAWAGPTSALLTWLYGTERESTHVHPLWLRVCGADVRTQFGALVGWDVTQAPMYLYPRWLVQVPIDGFTDVVPR